MAKFNTTNKGINKTTNHEGAPAYKLNSEMELYSTVCTASLSNKFYESSNETTMRIRKLIKLCEPEFVAQLAVYAREKMYLRSVPLLLTVELAKNNKGTPLISKLASRIIQRPDEITEMLAYYQLANCREGTKKLGKLSKQLQKGVGHAFNKFDEYGFAKYNRKTDVTLKDALFLTHPKAKDDNQQKLFDKIVNDSLEVPYTWEVELSKGDKDKKVVWEELIDSGKLGYMALMRNLRNMLDAGVTTEHIQKVAARLSNAEEVRKSRQLPFRFLSAYKELKENDNPLTSTLLNALEDAIIVSVENLKGYGYDTTVTVACDVSGSMMHSINERSKIELYDIGLLLGMLLQNNCKSVISGIFGDTWETVQMPQKSILQNVMELKEIEGRVGYSTNGHKVLEYLTEKKVKTDKVMMFTDCQMWDSESSSYWGNGSSKTDMRKAWNNYKKFNPEAKLYLFDLAGYGTTSVSVNENDVFLIAGWSDKVFEVLATLEEGGKALDVIKKIEL